MTEIPPADAAEPPEQVDGRVARRQRNQEAVLDVVLEMFADDMMFPTMEQAATRSGLSLRSLYRYYADPGELVEAAILRSRERARDRSHLPQIGRGAFERRLDDFVSMRVRLYESTGPMFRATIHNSTTHHRVGAELQSNRQLLCQQFELQFEPELSALAVELRSSALEAGNALTQIDSIDLFRRVRGLSIEGTEAMLRTALSALLVS